MRKDMKHVIIDRPRTGGDGGKSIPPKGTKKRLQKQMLDEDNTVSYESTARRRVYGWDCKELNEHLSPLVRWLSKQVGRNWDDVWSEICDGLSIRNATTAHVRDHADQFVEKNCTLVDGVLCNSRGEPLNKTGWRWHRFYVDPADNTLREFGDRPKYRYSYNRRKDWVEGDNENVRYYLFDGIWYEVELKPYPALVSQSGVWDVVSAAKWGDRKRDYRGTIKTDCVRYYGREVYAARKRQLNKKEIRRLKLWESDIVK